MMMPETSNNNEIKSNVEDLTLYNNTYPFNLSLRIKNFENEKELFKYAKNVEVLIRRSMEYKLWRNYITDILQINSCVLTDERMDELSIEIHHHIPSLFIIVKTIINKYIHENKEFSTFDIALDCMKIHFMNYLGYIPIIKSLHEKFHNGYLEIPVNLVKGNYLQFISEYGKYMDDEDSEIVNYRLSITTNSDYMWSKNNYTITGK